MVVAVRMPAEHPLLGAGVELLLEKEPPAAGPWRRAWPGDSNHPHLVGVTSASSAKAPMWRPRNKVSDLEEEKLRDSRLLYPAQTGYKEHHQLWGTPES